MGGDGARDMDWLRARGHQTCITDTIFLFKLELVGWGTRSFGEIFGRQGITALYPYSRSNAACTNGVKLSPFF